MARNKQRNVKILVALLCCLLSVACVSLIFGQIQIPLGNTIAILCKQFGFTNLVVSDFTQEQEGILWHIRMPRTLVGLLVGAALGTAGAVMQGIFSNPLADPGIIGVSSGAATGAVIAIALGFSTQGMFYMPLFAFIGAISAVTITVFLSMRQGKIPVMTLLLAGVVVGMLLGALTSAVLTFMNEQKLQQYLFWTVGGLDYRRWEHVYLAIGPISIGLTIMLLMARHLNVLVLGESEAKAVGMSVMPFRLFLLFVASMTTATAVCVSGNVGFVGLIVPHMMRMIVGPDHSFLLPASAMAGATFLVICDTLGRVIMPPTEVRVGIMTALIGTPYFLYLLRKIQK